MQSLAEIIDRIRVFKNLKNDYEVANLLGIKPKTLAASKVRNSIPYEELTAFCNKENISLNWMLTGTGPPKIPIESTPEAEQAKLSEEYVFVPQLAGKISAGGGLVPENWIEIKIAFRKEWIKKKGDPQNMSLIKVSGDSMEPTLMPGDMVLVDHSRDYLDPQGGIYAISVDHTIMIKRLQAEFPNNTIRIISDNPKYKTIETKLDKVHINGKVIWFGREIER